MSRKECDELTNEANLLFKHLAIDFLTKNVAEYDVSDTYDSSKPDCDPVDLMNAFNKDDVFPSYLQPIFSANDGQIFSFEERFFSEEKDEGNAQRSMSIRRAPNVKAFNSLRGSSTNVPFLPGGFDEEVEKLFRLSDREEVQNEEEHRFLDASEILDTPPGFEHSIQLSEMAFEPGLNTSVDTPFRQSLTVNDINSNILGTLSAELSAVGSETVSAPVVPQKSIVKLVATTMAASTAIEPQMVLDEDIDEKLQEAIESNNTVSLSVESGLMPEAERRRRVDDDAFHYAQMIDLTRPAPKYAEMKASLARSFPFELDPFQQHAVVSMEEGTSVFIAAHTSAGKTVVAEYAIALCKIHKTRVIYTSPIKALSNQKYRDFRNIFEDIGLVTGDIQLNTDAFCLIMTTEILRSMIYNGSEVIRELEWVIFDEVHYINDAERGYVWEEILIMLPAHVRIVMLSATVPNCMEFADWVGRIKNRRINVIQTAQRPVPLEHFVYTGRDGRTRHDRFLVLNKAGQFVTQNYMRAAEAKRRSMSKNMRLPHERQPYEHANDRNIYTNLIDHLQSRDLLPMVVFIFSRKRCDQTAALLQAIDLTTAKEKSEVHRFFAKCVERLKGSDRELPQLLLMREHCKRGFAVHHSGILPIIKEVVELLFQRGYVKILFATETFAMGVNMPARTVVFDTIEKFDGNSRRFLNVTEYVQMAGRAGRRGLDSTGTVIIISKGNELPELSCLVCMLTGKPIHLESRFRITYGMILNLLRVEQLRIEDMMQRSFVERNSLKLMSTRKEQLQELTVQSRELLPIDCALCNPHGLMDGREDEWTYLNNNETRTIIDYFNGVRTYVKKTQILWPELVLRHGLDKMFALGRIITFNYPPLDLYGRLGVILQTQRSESGIFYMSVLIAADDNLVASAAGQLKTFENMTMEKRRWYVESNIVRHYATHGIDAITLPDACHLVLPSAFGRNYHVIERLGLELLSGVCKKSLKIVDADMILREFHGMRRMNRDVSPTGVIQSLTRQLNEMATAWFNITANDETTPFYVIGKDIMKPEINVHRAIGEVRDLRAQLANEQRYPCRACPAFDDHFQQLLTRVELEERRQLLAYQTSSDALRMSGDYADRLCVLKALDYVDRNNMTGMKGKVACEINHQELLITELMLENKFEGLSCAEIAAMLSPLTCKDAGVSKSSANTATSHVNNKKNQQEGNVRVVPVEENSSSTNGQVADSVGTAAGSSESFRRRKNKKKNEVQQAPAEVIERLRAEVMDVAAYIDEVQQSHHVHTFISPELNYGLMEVVYQWASGMPFSDIMKLTEAQEGIIVRCIQRLDEVLKDVRKAARIVGNPDLYEQMEATSAAIKRDIVFAASLYTVDD